MLTDQQAITDAPTSEVDRLRAEAEDARELAEGLEALGLDPSITPEDLLARMRKAVTATEPAYSVAHDHPLATHDFAGWLRFLVDEQARRESSGFAGDTLDRSVALDQLLERVEAHDVDGLRGVLHHASKHLDVGEQDLLNIAIGDFGRPTQKHAAAIGEPLRSNGHVVPAKVKP